MIARRRWPKPTGPATETPSPSGPRCARSEPCRSGFRGFDRRAGEKVSGGYATIGVDGHRAFPHRAATRVRAYGPPPRATNARGGPGPGRASHCTVISRGARCVACAREAAGRRSRIADHPFDREPSRTRAVRSPWRTPPRDAQHPPRRAPERVRVADRHEQAVCRSTIASTFPPTAAPRGCRRHRRGWFRESSCVDGARHVGQRDHAGTSSGRQKSDDAMQALGAPAPRAPRATPSRRAARSSGNSETFPAGRRTGRRSPCTVWVATTHDWMPAPDRASAAERPIGAGVAGARRRCR